MEQPYLWLLTLMLAVTLVYGLLKPQRLFEFPYFMAAALIVFVLPQAVALIRFPEPASEEAVQRALLMTCLCFGMCLAGYQMAPSKKIVETLARPVDPDRFFKIGVVFVVVGFVFNYLLGAMTYEARGGSMWTGRATIYLYFANVGNIGLAIALLRALKVGGFFPWAVVAFACWIPLHSIIFHGRREQAVLFAATVALSVFFGRGWIPSRVLVVVILTGVTLFIPATGVYRGAMETGDIEGLKRVEWVNNFKSFIEKPSILELRNAAMIIQATVENESYEYGSAYWDQVIFRFVPAQLVGRDMKDALMIHTQSDRVSGELLESGYRISIGSTVTGMADSFKQFGYFGCLFFALLALLSKSFWTASITAKSVLAQVLYIGTFTAPMRAVTHQTVDYFPGLLYTVIFLVVAFLYSKQPPTPLAKRPRPLSLAQKQ